jgi:hypothetical protein
MNQKQFEQFDSMNSSRYEHIIALIEQEAQEAVEDGCGDRADAILAILDGIAQDLNLTPRA